MWARCDGSGNERRVTNRKDIDDDNPDLFGEFDDDWNERQSDGDGGTVHGEWDGDVL